MIEAFIICFAGEYLSVKVSKFEVINYKYNFLMRYIISISIIIIFQYVDRNIANKVIFC